MSVEYLNSIVPLAAEQQNRDRITCGLVQRLRLDCESSNGIFYGTQVTSNVFSAHFVPKGKGGFRNATVLY